MALAFRFTGRVPSVPPFCYNCLVPPVAQQAAMPSLGAVRAGELKRSPSQMKRNGDITAFRITSVVIPTIISLSTLFTFDWLFVLSSQGSPLAGCGNRADGMLIRSHLIPSIVISLLLVLASLRFPIVRLRCLFVSGCTALARTLLFIHIHVWLPRLVGGWWINVDIDPLLYHVPIVGTLTSVGGLLIGYLVSVPWARRNTR